MTDADDPFAPPKPPARPVDVILDRLMGAGLVLLAAVAVTVAALPLAVLLGLWVRVFRWAAGV